MTKNKEKNAAKQYLFLVIYLIIFLIIPITAYITGYQPKYPKIDYIEELDDLPLPFGFKIDNEKTVIFDTPRGKIIEISASGKAKAEEIEAFYGHSLPELGWKSTEKGLIFQREGEKLQIILRPQGNSITLEFLLSPAV